MKKGFFSVLYWLFISLLTACGGGGSNSPSPSPKPTPPISKITVNGQVVLGPVMEGHSLKLIISDKQMNQLSKPPIGADGTYSFTLEDYNGVVIAQVTSNNPDQCSGDYIDEATAKPKCLGHSTLLSSTVVKSSTTGIETKLYTTPVTTIAAYHAGINLDESGSLSVPEELSEQKIEQSNKIVANVFGMGEQSVAEYEPKTIISADQKYQSGDNNALALAAISGIEAATSESLDDVVKTISTGIKQQTDGSNSVVLDKSVQNLMVKGVQKVAEKIQSSSEDQGLLKELNKHQKTYPDSNDTTDLTQIIPKQPIFTHTTTTTFELKPTWQWKTGGTGNQTYQYRFNSDEEWQNTTTDYIAPQSELNSGQYTLQLREGNSSGQWSVVTSSTIEIMPNALGTVSIESEAIQKATLTAIALDEDGIGGKISYQWQADGKPIDNNRGKNKQFTLTQNEVGKRISVNVTYKDGGGKDEAIQSDNTITIKDVNDEPTGQITILGSSIEKQTLTFQDKVVDLDGRVDGSSQYTWLADEIVVGTDQSYTLQQKDVGRKIAVKLTYKDLLGNQYNILSSPTNPVQNINDRPSITDISQQKVTEGDTFTYQIEVADIDNISNFTYKLIDEPPKMKISDTGKISWIPPDDVKDSNLSITVEVNDGSGATNATTVIAFDLEVTAENDKPQAIPQSLTTTGQEPLEIRLSGTDPDGFPPEIFRITRKPNHGRLRYKVDGVFKVIETYPKTIPNGVLEYVNRSPKQVEDSFIFEVLDDEFEKGQAQITITVTQNNTPPQAMPNDMQVEENQSVEITLTGTDPDGAAPSIFKITALPKYGELKKRVDQKIVKKDEQITGELIYENRSDTATEDSFKFQAFDSMSYSENATVNINIQPVNDKPIIERSIEESENALEGVPRYRRVIVKDVDSDQIKVSFSSRPEWLQFLDYEQNQLIEPTGTENGAFIYTLEFEGTPQQDHIGQNQVELLITDNQGDSTSHKFNINVKNTDDQAKSEFFLDGDKTKLTKAQLSETQLKQKQSLRVSVTDEDGIRGEIAYSWCHKDEEYPDGICNSPLSTNSTYTFQQTDVNNALVLLAIYVDDRSGDIQTVRHQTGIIENVNDKPKGKPTIKGEIKQNKTLIANTDNIEDADGIVEGTYKYQ